MKKKILIGSIIAVAIIVLSSFSSVIAKVSADDELVEFDVEFCGLGKKHTVELTQQEADEIELLFDDIEQRLSTVETREEAEEIFKESIVELDKYGLLGSLSVQQAQRLVMSNSRQIKSTNKNLLDNNSNFLCLIAGMVNSEDIFFQGPIMWGSNVFFAFLLNTFFKIWDLINKIPIDLTVIIVILGWFLLVPAILGLFTTSIITTFTNFRLFCISNAIGVGMNGGPTNRGWIFSFGLNGIKKWEGFFRGNLPLLPIALMYPDYFSIFSSYEYPMGVFCFTGIHITRILNREDFFIGFSPLIGFENV